MFFNIRYIFFKCMVTTFDYIIYTEMKIIADHDFLYEIVPELKKLANCKDIECIKRIAEEYNMKAELDYFDEKEFKDAMNWIKKDIEIYCKYISDKEICKD